ncbi:MAG TPA: acetyl-CoA carboxylase biotin carboxyl carrier protein [Fodinibius sp.]|nr:acetyl-CoA carboxylase biotin carboxyl carrier protein [Fodinibius sp.]
MDLKIIENLLDLIARSEVNEVSIEEGDFKIKVKKKADTNQPAATIPYQMPAQTVHPSAGGQQDAPQPTAQAPEEEDNKQETSEAPDGEVVKSPIVGTFYRSPSPDDDPFVSVGDQIEKGQTVCIVEAMKIMNEIESDYSGEIKKILINDAEPVEYDQPLFIIG